MTILRAFAPFLIFATLARAIGIHGALLAATAVAALQIARDTLIRRRSVKLLEIGSLILFGALAGVTWFPQVHLSVLQVRLCVDGGLLAIVTLSILVGRPFTLAYASERVGPRTAATPAVRALATRISLAWAGAFLVVVAADAAMIGIPGFTAIFGTVIILAALGGAAWFTSWAPRSEAAHP
jgi:hypothetical protein